MEAPMSSHKAVNTEKAAPQSERPNADIDLSMLLGDDEAEAETEVDEDEAAGAPLSASALRSAHIEDDEDDDDDDEDDDVAASPRPTSPDLDDEGIEAVGAFRAGAEPAVKPFREDSRVDRRIIEGMLRDRDTFIEEMEHEGFTQAAVLRRAAELGLSEALIRQVKGVAADLAGERPGRRPAPSSLGARTCLSCDRVFLSSGPGNRLCMRCRGGDAGLAQL
jgi:hypothetical protein